MICRMNHFFYIVFTGNIASYYKVTPCARMHKDHTIWEGMIE